MTAPEKKVSFVFYCYEKESADLKIRLRYDQLKQSQFFTEILKMYVSQDPLILEVVEKIKKKNKTMGAKKIKKTREDYNFSKKLEADLGLTPEDKQKIFDIIEGELEINYD